MAKNVNHRANLRYARILAYKFVMKVTETLEPRWAGEIPMELSVKESNIEIFDNGDEEKSLFTFRFAGGIWAKARVTGIYDPHYLKTHWVVDSLALGLAEGNQFGCQKMTWVILSPKYADSIGEPTLS